MILLLFLLIISILLIFTLKFISFMLSEKRSIIREEISSYECGFEHSSLSRVPFSLRYFFLTLVFLLFDLEIILIMFIPYTIFSSNYLLSILILFFFIFILYISLIYEWNDGSLEWVS